MTLIGVPLILVAGAATLTVIGLLGWSWNRGGRRRRLPTRVLGVLLGEALLVLTIGLVANRQELFYPSWQALAGRTSTTAGSVPVAAGRLDASLARHPDQPWQPAGSAAWHLAAPPAVTVPAAYPVRPVAFPVLLALGGRPAPADLVEVRLEPGPRTDALAGLPGLLAGDLRVTSHGWVIVAAAARVPLAGRLVAEFPGRFTALAVTGHAATPPGCPVPVHDFATWAAATRWAVAQSPPALEPARVLPPAEPS
ncbi:hypothetical protein GCM10020358_61840 [Amorphoplanes nipponensis]|uniref:Uncharacterized protein n=1 Tax=Actinoplanes nipponensis TaxID=135950 RepID=A0A919JRK1_9ACTN|nr:hypothetical protein [Actinoplanes nipponensis]GIE53986.1 hypothetical protein Ani05nite_75200 [Actinoplanes nipponensis]